MVFRKCLSVCMSVASSNVHFWQNSRQTSILGSTRKNRNVTCVDTLAGSYVSKTSVTAGAAAELSFQIKKWQIYQNKIILLPFQSPSVWNYTTMGGRVLKFHNRIGTLLVKESGDHYVKQFYCAKDCLLRFKGEKSPDPGLFRIPFP